jgi:tetratricopeptide (TPR) repeat protein
VVELCEHLDGLPLALELAAPRLGSMTPAEIIATLGSHVQMSRGASTEDPRHETLDATIGWSYELLPAEPRRLLDRLGVMSGSFLFKDVLSVCAVQGDVSESTAPDTLREWLSSLVDQSLVMADTSGARTRYRLLETIRRFALVHLGPDEPQVRKRHAQHFGEVAEFQAGRLLGREERDAARELFSAYDNLRSAIGWAMEEGDVDTASRIVASMADGGYWRCRYELSTWAQWVWAATTPEHPRWRAVCGCAARGAWIAGRFDQAIQFGRASAKATGTIIARAGHPDDVVADIALYSGDARAALAHYSRAAARAHEDQDLVREVWATYYVAVINAVLRQPSNAVEAATKALAGARETGNPSALSFCLYAHALAVKHRSPAEAVAMFEEAVAMAESVGNDWFGGIAQMELASTKASHGDPSGGLQDFAVVIDHWHRAGDDTQLRLTWRYLVAALVEAGRHEEAAVLVGALLTDTRSVLTQPHPKLLEDLRGVLGEAEYGRFTVRGSIMSVPELVVTSLDAIQEALRVPPGS